MQTETRAQRHVNDTCRERSRSVAACLGGTLAAAVLFHLTPAWAADGVLAAPGSGAMRTRLEAMSEKEVKDFYTRCSEESIAQRLDGGEAMACSIGYEVLLQKHFGGDFGRLLVWSRGR